MKDIFHKKGFQIISSVTLFIISIIIFNYTYLATLHGNSDAPIIVGVFGIVALLISYIFNLKALTITATFGYIIAFFIGVFLETDGIVMGDGAIHQLWTVWLFSYWIFIGIGTIYDFVKKIKRNHLMESNKSKNVVLYIGLFVGIFMVLGSIFTYISKPLTMNNVLQHKPKFTGIVREVSEQSILVKVNEAEDEFQSSDLMRVSLDVEIKDSVANFNIGDEVAIYYDGNIAESYPAQINKVYAITRINSSHSVEDIKEEAKEDIRKFTKEEIAEAIKIVEDNFNFPASTLTKVWYDEEESYKLGRLYLESGRGSVNGVEFENVIVLLSNFDVDDSGDNPVLNPDSTYENFQWILIRDSKESDWIIDDWGY